MKILVDADACPVKNIIETTAQQYKLEVIMICCVNSPVTSQYAQVIIVDGFSQAADIAIVNKTEKGDIVVTHDYGVAAMVLEKGAMAINPSGKEYTDNNIEELLMQRFINFKARQSGMRTTRFKKRNREDDEHFKKTFVNLIEKSLLY
ncbi:MAG: YaiI/YqxD family protein [Syntrophomonadaceae bacterium]|nr:YaiI/YqxD family protein [Syntrophomonadaceae bacterium]MDD3888365.1 YaiI/YqxD family protein [Syntrophomonadaceae bacterium]MDD4548871.1 YaiI/YqxD family protein [Syntrophomonadaceae bacterium]